MGMYQIHCTMDVETPEIPVASAHILREMGDQLFLCFPSTPGNVWGMAEYRNLSKSLCRQEPIRIQNVCRAPCIAHIV